jgi:hypothetical protein
VSTATDHPRLRVLSRAEAVAQGYRRISMPVNRKSESAVFEAMDQGLSTCDAAWIDIGRGRFEAARRASEIVTS